MNSAVNLSLSPFTHCIYLVFFYVLTHNAEAMQLKFRKGPSRRNRRNRKGTLENLTHRPWSGNISAALVECGGIALVAFQKVADHKTLISSSHSGCHLNLGSEYQKYQIIDTLDRCVYWNIEYARERKTSFLIY